jgi:hypothetical protein
LVLGKDEWTDAGVLAASEIKKIIEYRIRRELGGCGRHYFE